ncbi:MAG: LamG domain-containing protein, partial [Myxococcota bacterium]
PGCLDRGLCDRRLQLGLQALIASGSLADYFGAELFLNQAEPISFSVRNLGDNVLATVGDTTEYTVTTCEPVRAELPQPSHWWRGEGSGTDAVGLLDLEGPGCCDFDGGVFGQALRLSGDSWISTPLSPVPTDGSYTISAWILPNAQSGPMTIASLQNGAPQAGDFHLRWRSDVGGSVVEFIRRPTSGSNFMQGVHRESPNDEVPSEAWSHITAVNGVGPDQEAQLRLYVDGIEVEPTEETSTYTPVGSSDYGFKLGTSELQAGNTSPRFPFEGRLDEIMIFDRALSSDEVQIHHEFFADYVDQP